jgi:P27 family predicted phage terminase small subunit
VTTKRGRKSLADLVVVKVSDHRLPPPAGLTDAQVEQWLAIVNSLPADYFRPGDAPLLAAFCIASVFHRRAADDIEERGISLCDFKGREFVNPSHQMLTSQASAMAQMAVKLRLCPSARMTGKAAQGKSGAAAKGARPWEAAQQ